MSGKVGKIRCKTCNCTFADTTEYLNFEGCDRGDCQMGRNKQARRQANEAIAKARSFNGGNNDMQQVETNNTFHSFEKENDCSFDGSDGGEFYERDCPKVITFHVMKR